MLHAIKKVVKFILELTCQKMQSRVWHVESLEADFSNYHKL